MASMRQLYPLHEACPKSQRNFIKENIRKAKGCSQCIAEKKNNSKDNNHFKKLENTRNSNLSKYKTEKGKKTPLLKCNVRAMDSGNECNNDGRSAALHEIKAFSTNPNNEEGSLEKTQEKLDSINSCVSCQLCGQHVINNNQNSKSTISVNEEKDDHPNSVSEKDEKNLFLDNDKNYHILSHENEEQCKMNMLLKKSLDLSRYKKGEVPRYLKERNARWKQEQQEQEHREKMAELMGLTDPKCPPNHMLMPPDQIKENLVALEEKYQSLILELNRMPVSSDSLRVRTRKIEIEKELKTLDDKIELNRSGKVFVKIPE